MYDHSNLYQHPYPYNYDLQMYYNIARQPVYYYPSYYDYINRNSYVHNINNGGMLLTDYGPNPITFNINEATKQNSTFRTVLWTGQYLQVTVMSIGVGEDIGIEMHPDVDQFLRIEQGNGLFQMGESKDRLNRQSYVSDDTAILIPAGTWHNIINTGQMPLKLYSIYAPPNHPFGTVHVTKADAAMEHSD